MMFDLLPLLQLVIAGALAGLIWTVQLAVYAHFPRLIARAGAEAFRAYHADYTRSMGYVAGPLMLAELAAVLALTGWGRGAFDGVGAGLVAALWLHTFGLMVPLHARLQAAPSEALARRLVTLNWLRTGLWSVRLAWVIWTTLHG